ncbi:MAG: tetratricopeptide repeat protein, partial [Planctomycetota bacterium]
MPVPPGLDASSLRPLAENDPSTSVANRSLDEVLAERPRTTAPPARAGLDNEDRARVAELRQIARERSDSGDRTGAIDALRRAAAIDETNADIWLDLGRERLRSREPARAIRAYALAIDLGSSSTEALLVVARATALRGDPLEAAGLFARALERAPEEPATIRAAVEMLALAGLGETLSEAGYVRAPLEANRRALETWRRIDMAELVRLDPGVAAQVTEVTRRAGELWTSIGDAAMRLGAHDAAIEAYEAALREPLLDPTGVDLRRLYAASRGGRHAAAALALLESVIREDGRIGDRRVATLRRLATRDGRSLAEPIRQGLFGIRDALEEPLSLSIEGGLVRCIAAMELPADAATRLLDWIGEHPHDLASVRAFLSESAGAADAVERLTTLSLIDASLVVEAARMLSSMDIEAREVLDAVRATNNRSLAAAIALEFGDADLAAELTEGALDTPVLHLLAVRAAVARRDWPRVSRVIDSIDPDRDETWRLAKARAQHAAQRFPEALETIAPMLNEAGAGPERLSALLLGAELALGAGRIADAERWLQQSSIADPADPRPYERLLQLHMPQGPLADRDALRATVRRLRQVDPSNPRLRLLAANELIARGQLARAEPSLLELIGSGVRTPEAFDALLRVWLRLSELDDGQTAARAERWLRARLDEAPNDPALLSAFTRLLVELDRAEEADALLAATLEA